MDEHDILSKIINFLNINDSEKRLEAIQDPVFKTQESLNKLKLLIDTADSEETKLDYLDHMNLLIQYQQIGDSAFEHFISFSQITTCFTEFAFGFDTFEKRKRYLLSKPFLMEEKSIKCITRLIEIERRQKMPSSIITKMRLYRNLLKACWSIGIENAFEEFETVGEEYIHIINALFRTDSLYDLLTTFGLYKNLVSSKTIRNAFHYLQAEYEKDKIKRARIIAIWDAISSYQKIERPIWFWNIEDK